MLNKWTRILLQQISSNPGAWPSDMPLPTDQEVPASIPGYTEGIFSNEELFHGMYGLVSVF